VDRMKNRAEDERKDGGHLQHNGSGVAVWGISASTTGRIQPADCEKLVDFSKPQDYGVQSYWRMPNGGKPGSGTA